MPDFKFHVGQSFDCSYVVKDADTVEDAWNLLIDGVAAECVEQIPGEITTTLATSGVATLTDGDWEDID